MVLVAPVSTSISLIRCEPLSATATKESLTAANPPSAENSAAVATPSAAAADPDPTTNDEVTRILSSPSSIVSARVPPNTESPTATIAAHCASPPDRRNGRVKRFSALSACLERRQLQLIAESCARPRAGSNTHSAMSLEQVPAPIFSTSPRPEGATGRDWLTSSLDHLHHVCRTHTSHTGFPFVHLVPFCTCVQ